MFQNFLLVMLGGGIGSAFRYAFSLGFNTIFTHFPLGTWLANVLSCLLLGVLVSLFEARILSENARILLIVGFCGGFSTFSTLINESNLLLSKNFRFDLVLYLLGSLVAGYLALLFGLWLGKK